MTINKVRNWLIISGFLGIMAAFLLVNRQPRLSGCYLTARGNSVMLELADTPEKRTQGLSGREFLENDRGMLFVFPQAGRASFWMKEMNFNLDYVFINGSRIVDLVENVPFPKEGEIPKSVRANQDFNLVLEINAGSIKNWNWQVGDRLVFSNSCQLP